MNDSRIEGIVRKHIIGTVGCQCEECEKANKTVGCQCEKCVRANKELQILLSELSDVIRDARAEAIEAAADCGPRCVENSQASGVASQPAGNVTRAEATRE